MEEQETNESVSTVRTPGSEQGQEHEEVESPASDETILEDIKHQIADVVQDVETARKLGPKGLIKAYFAKFAGNKEKRPKSYVRMPFMEAVYSWIAAFIGIGFIAALHYHWLSKEHLVLVVGSFGASAVLIFGAVKSPLAQPRNFVGGHLISAIVGVTIRWAVYEESIAIAAGFAVATAISLMILTNTVHPPGGATALIAVTTQRMAWGGYLYVFMPILTGCACLLFVAVFVNNLFPTRKYPSFWW